MGDYRRASQQQVEDDELMSEKEQKRRRSRTSSTRSVNQEPVSIDGYCRDGRLRCLAVLYSVLSLGFLQLVFFWRPVTRMRMTHRPCDLAKADKVLIQDFYSQQWVETVHTETIVWAQGTRVETVRFFIHKKVKYLWEERVDQFVQLRGFRENCPCSDLHEAASGLSSVEQARRQRLFGDNLIKVQVRPIAGLILHEALNPFYVFQVYSSVVWLVQDYVLYTTAVMLLATISIGVTVYETRKQSKALRNRVKSSSDVDVYRGLNVWETVSSEQLVPGDVIQVRAGTSLECDAVLLDGSVIVNESMLTGESVPVSKVAVPDHPDLLYHPDTNKRHTLYCGTRVLLTHGAGVRAIVVRTGFATAKGELVRSILFPKPVDLQFYSDSMRFLGISFLLGLIAMVYTTVFHLLNHSSMSDVIVNALDIVTFVVPPSLPATVTIGNIYAQRRLKQHNIFCLSSKYINLSGSVNVVCFDKTGTLTHDGLDLEGVVGVTQDNTLGRLHTEFDSQTLDYQLLHLMACCHSNDVIEGVVTGDPLDMVMFNDTGWSVADDSQLYAQHFSYPVSRVVLCEETGDAASLVHQFPFLSGLQRMSVVVEYLVEGFDGNVESKLSLYVKGAPETVAGLCLPHSVPTNLNTLLQRYTGEGYRVIALAHRPLPLTTTYDSIRNSRREELETDLLFVGLLVLQNRLKPESARAITSLHHANIRTVMVTGDNLLTAIHTARGCGMVLDTDTVVMVTATPNAMYTDARVEYTVTHSTADDTGVQQNGDAHTALISEPRYHFAMDGSTYTYLRVFKPELLDKLVQRGTVFARMLPELKVRLIEQYQELGYRVGMCGDGANDCGALKTAHTGVSLSTAEASVASPFTSTSANIQCVPAIIREGRCSLVSSFGLFKFVLGCSWVFCIAVLILYKISCDMVDVQYMYLDLVLILLPSIFIANISAYPAIAKVAPPPNLTDNTTVTSLLGFILLQTVFISGAWIYLHQQPWFLPWNNTMSSFMSYENTVIFSTMSVSFCVGSVVFSQGAPYRRAFYTNKLFTLMVLVASLFTVLFLVQPPAFVIKLCELMPLPQKFTLVILTLSASNLLLSLLLEDILINKVLHLCFLPWLRKVRGPKHLYEELEKEMAEDPTWPPFELTKCTNDLNLIQIQVKNTTEKPSFLRHNMNKEVCFSSYESIADYDKIKRESTGLELKRQSARLSSSFAVLNTAGLLAKTSKSMPALDKAGRSELKLWKKEHRRSYVMDKNCVL